MLHEPFLAQGHLTECDSRPETTASLAINVPHRPLANFVLILFARCGNCCQEATSSQPRSTAQHTHFSCLDALLSPFYVHTRKK